MAITRKNTIPEKQQSSTPPLPPPTPAPLTETNLNNEQTQPITETTASDYEQTRELRIKENRERLMKLGIVDLSLQFKSISSTPARRTPRSSTDRVTPLKSPSLGPTEPRRRSSRLQNAPAVSYVEPKEEKSKRGRDVVLEEGARPEVYTEEHDKLLGNTEMPWEFFVDGYSADGTRIYDPVNGKTCHQCRQKTLGKRTRCSNCNLVQGQFCGDCLIMRYGEHVVEASQNPNWLCPPCRGICNCSLCRQAKGWYPTGTLYKRISKLGYKSVAHYLIQTKRAPTDADTVSDPQQSAKRCLPFEGMEVPTDDKTEISMQSKNDDAPDTDPNATPEGVRRSGRNSKKENHNAGDLTGHGPVPDKKIPEVNADAVEEEPVHDKKSKVAPDTEPNLTPEGVRRSGRHSKKENHSAGELAGHGAVPDKKIPGVNADVVEEEPVHDKKSKVAPDTEPNLTPEGVRRSARHSKKENHSAGELAGHGAVPDKMIPEVNADMVEDVPVHVKKSPGVIGRPRKRSKTENVDFGKQIASEELALVAVM